MSEAPLSIIIMREDERVKRLSVRPLTIRLFIYFVLLLVLVAGAGGYAGYYFFMQNHESEAARQKAEKSLADLTLKLNRLQNIEQLLQSSDPSELKTLLGSMGFDPPKEQAAKEQGKNKQAAPPAQAPPPSAPVAAAQAEKEPGREPEKTAPSVDLNEVLTKVDLQLIQVENLKLKFDKQAIQVRFDLNNLQNQQALVGSAQIYLVTRTGQLVALEAPKEELNFQIQRFKQVTANPQAPAGLEKKDIFGLKLTINNSAGKTIFSDTYPLSLLQS